MPNLLENVFTADAVQNNWSPIIRQAWLERKTNPDGYLRCLPSPGQRLATGPWSVEEEAIFEQRLAEFRQNKWPISYWGIFSLVLPHRTGSQCRHFYRHSRWQIAGEETASIPLAALRDCLEKHKPTLSTLWTSPVAQQISTRVDAWLRGERSPTSKPSIVAQPTLATLQKSLNTKAKNNSKQLPLAELKQGKTLDKQPKKAKTLSGTKRGPPLATTKSAPAAKTTLKRGFGNKNTSIKAARRGDSSSSEDEFVAGTLRKVQTIAQPPPTVPSTTATTAAGVTSNVNSGKAAALKGKRRAPRRRPALLADGTAAVAIQHEFDDDEMDRMTIIRLDKEKNLPGWVAREVTPYLPPKNSLGDLPLGAAATTAVEGSKIIPTKDILTFDFASLGSGTITGVVINAPLSDDPQTGVTISQLTTLPLTDCLATDAIVCLWATKQHVGQAVNCMAKAWGCKYVENLTWVHIAPNGDVAKGPSTLTRTSHSTLLMGRRGGGELELRHQRSPDVIVEPVRGGGKFPDSVREMMETLLPEAKHGGKQQKKGSKTQPPPPPPENSLKQEEGIKNKARFLEISFHGAEPGVRSGWVKLVQQ